MNLEIITYDNDTYIRNSFYTKLVVKNYCITFDDGWIMELKNDHESHIRLLIFNRTNDPSILFYFKAPNPIPVLFPIPTFQAKAICSELPSTMTGHILALQSIPR